MCNIHLLVLCLVHNSVTAGDLFILGGRGGGGGVGGGEVGERDTRISRNIKIYNKKNKLYCIRT